MARPLLNYQSMIFKCDHCDQITMGKPYRVRSEEEGVVMLDMTVCYVCFIDARRLGLHGEEMQTLASKSQPASH